MTYGDLITANTDAVRDLWNDVDEMDRLGLGPSEHDTVDIHGEALLPERNEAGEYYWM